MTLTAKSTRTLRRHLFRFAALIILIIIFVYLLAPFYMIVNSSFKTLSELRNVNFTIIPVAATLQNFNELFNETVFFTNLLNSLRIASITMVLAIILALPTAYAMCRFRNKLTRGMVVWILLSQMIPGIIMVVPIFNVLATFGLTNTHAGLIICYAVFSLPFTCWMLRGFIAAVPVELEEAAELDGCSTVGVVVRILIPVIAPGILTGGIFAFITSWNELFFSLSLIRSPALQTLPVHIQSFMGLAGEARIGMVAAASFISSIPGIIVFLVLQNFFIKGLTSGSVK